MVAARKAPKKTAAPSAAALSPTGALAAFDPQPKAVNTAGGVPLAQRMRALSRFRENYNILRGLSLQRAVELSQNYFRGYMADTQWLYYFIEQTDPDLFALVDRRSSRLLEMDYSVKINTDADEAKAKLQAELLEEKFDKIDNLYDGIEHLALASFRGYAHCEKWFDDQGELFHLEIVDQWNVVRDGLRGSWKYNPEALQTSYFALPQANAMPPDQFLFREVRRHINRIALIKFLRANLCDKDWDAFIEIYGIPGGVLVGPPNIQKDDVPAFEAAAKEIAEGGTGFAPNGSDWKPNVAARGTSPFKERLDYLSEKLVLVGTGGMLTMLARSGTGTLAGKAHADVFEQLAKAEARKISEILNRQLVKPWLDAKFPGEKQLAYFQLAANEETSTTQAVQDISALGLAGYLVDPDEVTQKTGYTVTLKPLPEKPEAPEDNAEKIANRRQAARIRNAASRAATGREAIYRAHALAQLTAAQAKVLRPITERLAEIADMEDEDEQNSALVKFQRELPKISKQMAKDPVLADAFEQILGGAMADGLGEAAKAKKGGS